MGLFSKKKKEEGVPGSTAAAGTGKTTDINDDSELIAVITAAISAYEAEQNKQTLYIRKLNRTAGTRPAWGLMGTNEAIDMRRI